MANNEPSPNKEIIMLYRTRFFLFGAIVATPVVAATTVLASTVIVSLLSDEAYDDLIKYMKYLREI
jgi:hypothetical protein